MNESDTPSGRGEFTERLVSDLGAAFQQRAVYASAHPQVRGALDRVQAAFNACCAQTGAAEVLLITLEGQLLIDRQGIPEGAVWARGLLRAFERHGIGGMTLLAGLDSVELGLFLDSCHNPTGPAPSRHILVGRAGFAVGDAPEGPGARGATRGSESQLLSPQQAEGARAELVGIASGAVRRIERLRDLVASLACVANAHALDSLSLTGSNVNDREFLHGLGVAFATLHLGRTLRIEGNALEDLALCGFVHDVGYLDAGGRDEVPDERRRIHPIRGASRLAALEGMPDMAVLVAYEHHLRFDGAPNYPAVAAPRKPIAAARVVAVADTWETLRSRGAPAADMLAILRSRAGTFLDPVLVELFAELVQPKEA